MIDGIDFGESMLLVAMGVTETLDKVTLGLKLGSSENAEVCKDLLTSIIERNLDISKNYLFVLDGSKALKSAVVKVFGKDVQIQRCVRHKERNILSYLPVKYHMEFRRRWKLIHSLVNFKEAQKELEKLKYYLKNINLEAHASLEESGEETLTVIKLEASTRIRRTLLSTNPMESIFSQVRGKTYRVKKWRKNTDQITRWSASLLLEIENKKIKSSYKKSEIESFKNNLNIKNNLHQNENAA